MAGHSTWLRAATTGCAEHTEDTDRISGVPLLREVQWCMVPSALGTQQINTEKFILYWNMTLGMVIDIIKSKHCTPRATTAATSQNEPQRQPLHTTSHYGSHGKHFTPPATTAATSHHEPLHTTSHYAATSHHEPLREPRQTIIWRPFSIVDTDFV